MLRGIMEAIQVVPMSAFAMHSGADPSLEELTGAVVSRISRHFSHCISAHFRPSMAQFFSVLWRARTCEVAGSFTPRRLASSIRCSNDRVPVSTRVCVNLRQNHHHQEAFHSGQHALSYS